MHIAFLLGTGMNDFCTFSAPTYKAQCGSDIFITNVKCNRNKLRVKIYSSIGIAILPKE